MVNTNTPRVDQGIGNNARTNWSGSNDTPTQQQQLTGFYIGQVMDDQDDQRMGRVWVYIQGVSNSRLDENSIPSYGGTAPDRMTTGGLDYDQRLRNGWLLVSPMTPFAGSDDYRNASRPDGSSSTNGDVNSYGMTAQPRNGDFIGVMFASGDPNSGYWMGMVPKQNRNGMVPGAPGTPAQDISSRDPNEIVHQVQPTAPLPILDRAPSDSDPTGSDPHGATDLARNIARAGVSGDIARGAGTSGVRRESPSYVTGIKTGGWTYDSEQHNRDTNGNQFSARISDLSAVNTTGHQFVMDDHPDHQLMRFRTSNGAQILLHDSGDNPFIYIQSGSGNSWVEISDSGDVSIYAKGGFHVHSEGDYNLTVDGDMNVEVKGKSTTRITGDHSVGVSGNSNTAVAGSLTVGIDGDYDIDIGTNSRTTYNGDLDLRVGNNWHNAIGGSWNTTTESACRFQSAGDMEIDAQSDLRMAVGGDLFQDAGGKIQTISGGDIGLQSGGAFGILSGDKIVINSGATTDIKSGDTIDIESGAAMSILGGGNIDVDGPKINLNGGGASGAATMDPVSVAVIGDFVTPDAANAPVLPDTHSTPSAPTQTQAIANEQPAMQDSVAPVVPQHQPWAGRSGIGNTVGTTGLVSHEPKCDGVMPRNGNTSCNRGDIFSNLRNGAGSLSALRPDHIVGGLTSFLGQLPTFGAASPYTGASQGEAPQHRSIRLAHWNETHLPDSLSPSTSIINYIKSQATMLLTPKLNAMRTAYTVGYGKVLQVGDIIGDNTVGNELMNSINSFSNDIQKSISITQSEAEGFLHTELNGVQTWIEVNFPDIEFTQSQYDALTSFVHHVTIEQLEVSLLGKELIASLQQGVFGKVQEIMYQFAHIGGAVDCSVLARRRTEVAGFSHIPDRDGVVAQNLTYSPSGQTVSIAGFDIPTEVFNAICNAQKNLAPQLPDGYLLTICSIESGFNPAAKASTSSAAGLFQFTIDTGSRYGLDADRGPTSNVYDIVANADAGASFNIDNYNVMVAAGLPTPNPTDIYMAHFLGVGRSGEGGAIGFIEAKNATPDHYPALNPSFRRAAGANKNIFYKHGDVNTPRTYLETYNVMGKKVQKRTPYFAGACGGQGNIPPQVGTLPAGSGGTGLVTWVPGARTPDFTNVGSIRAIVETAASQAGINQLAFNSGYRDPATNSRVGGARNSQHLYGKALDIHIGDMTVAQKRSFAERLIQNGVTGFGIGTNTYHVDNRAAPRVTWKYRGGNAYVVDILRQYGFRGSGVA